MIYAFQRIVPGLPFYRIVAREVDVEQYLRSRGYDVEVSDIT